MPENSHGNNGHENLARIARYLAEITVHRVGGHIGNAAQVDTDRRQAAPDVIALA
jgi:hypothetical protein